MCSNMNGSDIGRVGLLSYIFDDTAKKKEITLRSL